MNKILVSNKKALFHFQIIDKYECGISLYGWEVKAIINSNANLDTAFIIIRNNEAFVINMFISLKQQNKQYSTDDSLRKRKLLLHKNEILRIQNYLKKHPVTVVPLDIHKANNKIKLLIAIVKRKNATDKRQVKKKRDEQREIKQYL